MTSWPTESSLVHTTVWPGLIVTLSGWNLMSFMVTSPAPPLAAGAGAAGVLVLLVSPPPRTPLSLLLLLSVAPAAARGYDAEGETGDHECQPALGHRGGTLENKSSRSAF